ncbi:hypothetical protein BV25DRAFT_1873293 [Artomyces pyxidatus]|uniref:Uncharacterized protein n=1 Tax=Artomyces pyxidatus TaxID=48021 RepID=A0ACB8SEN5_9AGAM|nr:hypothetical protein BV25DRAFT_1873293 [Artomyces pyxidatus]
MPPSGRGRKRKATAVIIRDTDDAPTPSSSSETPTLTVTHNTRHFNMAVRRNAQGRRRITQQTSIIVEELPAPPRAESDSMRAESERPDDAFDVTPDVDDNHGHLSVDPLPQGPPPLKRQRRRAKRGTGNPLRDWIPFRDTFLDELLRHEGLGNNTELPHCQSCQEAVGELKCRDCTGALHLCAGCIVSAHAMEPLHRIERWNGKFFEPHSLEKAGLRVQLGHDGQACPMPHFRKSPISVIHTNGFHSVAINFCDCGRAGSSRRIVQLLRARWWPATVNRPQTVTTFAVLKLFHALTLQGKVNAYDFYMGLVRLTDGLGTRPPKYRYKEFIRSMRCFRHIRAAKRAGRGHDPEGIEATGPGEFVVECPLCPHPGRNMPEGWEDAPEDEKWKHAMFLAIDANFKLKLKNRGLKDISLAPGWGYFVNKPDYEAFLADYVDEPEMKHCDSNHSAIDHANTPAQRRFAVNGVGAVVCNRHIFNLKQCMGDLERGERYSNMTYMLLATLSLTVPDIKTLFISYDIACSFYKNFEVRMAKHPESRQLDLENMSLKWAVPKFHLLAHGAKCQTPFSLNLMYGVGRTHGEGVETGWAEMNGAALSTREMAGSARHEVLDDVLGAINWRKLINIGKAMKAQIKGAVAGRLEQKGVYEEMKETVPVLVAEKWDAMVLAYRKSDSAPNPYVEPVPTTTLADVRIDLADEEAKEAQSGQVSMHEMTASVFLSVGMELEELQRGILATIKTSSKTAPEKAAIKKKQSVLRHRISAWRDVQQIYMPGISHLIAAPSSVLDAADDGTPISEPEKMALHLPSQISVSLRLAGCVPGLVDKEARLRQAQAEDALHQVRRALRTRLALIRYKHVQVDGPGQKSNTRARNLLKRLQEKLQRHVERYRCAYAALETLAPDGTWKTQLRKLNDDDIRSPRLEDGKLGEGHHEVSWIWRVLSPDARDVPLSKKNKINTTMSEEDIHDSVRVDYVKTQARYLRWEEEITHLLEEMPRCLRFMEWRAETWLAKLDSRPDAPSDIQSGLNAFCHRQAAHSREIALSFGKQWRPVLSGLGLLDRWPADVSLPLTTSLVTQETLLSEVRVGGGLDAEQVSDTSEESVDSQSNSDKSNSTVSESDSVFRLQLNV